MLFVLSNYCYIHKYNSAEMLTQRSIIASMLAASAYAQSSTAPADPTVVQVFMIQEAGYTDRPLMGSVIDNVSTTDPDPIHPGPRNACLPYLPSRHDISDSTNKETTDRHSNNPPPLLRQHQPHLRRSLQPLQRRHHHPRPLHLRRRLRLRRLFHDRWVRYYR